MKIKSLILAMAACAGLFTACTNELDNGSTTDPNETAGKTFMTLTFSTSNNVGTKADLTYAEATENEYTISDANIFLFGVEDNLLKQVITQNPSTLKDGTNPVQKEWTTEPFPIIPGAYKVYVVVNEGSDNKLTTLPAGTSFETFKEKVFTAAITTATYCSPKHFLMTNAYEVTPVKEGETVKASEGVIEVTAANDKDNPAAVEVHVERAAAKITLAIPANKKVAVNAKETKIADLEFMSYKIVNTRNSAFFQRRVSTGTTNFTSWTVGGAETNNNGTPTNYVLDNIFGLKSNITDFTKSDYQSNYSRKHNTYVAWRALDNSGTQTLAYCLENTMKQADDKEGLVTTVIFRAKYTPAENTIKGTKPTDWDGTFYRYPKGSNASILYYTLRDLIEGVYTNLANAKAQGRFGLTDIDVTNETELNAHLATLAADQDALFKTYSTEQYPQGYCYYKYFIRHIDNGDSEDRGIMEHVIVRNNVYTLSIKSVSGLGSISSGTNGPEEGDLVNNPKFDPEQPVGPNNPEKVPGPGVDEPKDNTTNPEIPGEVDPTGPIEPITPIIPIDPNNPTENKTTFLEVTVKVLKWIQRNNEIEL